MSDLSQWIGSEPSPAMKRLVLMSFPFLVPLVLAMEPLQLGGMGPNGQLVTNLASIVFFTGMLFALSPQQKLIALVFVPFSAAGEFVFSLIFGLYHYRLGEIPLYVPYGHAILFSVGLLICESNTFKKYEAPLRPIFIGLYVALFSIVIVLLKDCVSVAFGLSFIWVLRRKGYHSLYFMMGLLVGYIELLGTSFGCWTWAAHPFGIDWIQGINPPFGAFVAYVMADLAVMKIVRSLAPHLGVAPTTPSLQTHIAG